MMYFKKNTQLLVGLLQEINKVIHYIERISFNFLRFQITQVFPLLGNKRLTLCTWKMKGKIKNLVNM